MNDTALEVVANSGAGVPLKIPTNLIRRNKGQIRTEEEAMEVESLKELAASIKSEGQLQAGSVRIINQETEPDPDHVYEINVGERRWRACDMLGIDYEATVNNPENKAQQLLHSVVENAHSKPNTLMEKSNALSELKAEGISVKRMQDATGWSDATIYQLISLQKLSPELQKLTHPKVRKGRLTFDIAKVLVRVEDHTTQEKILLEVLSVERKKRKALAVVLVDVANKKEPGKNRGLGAEKRKPYGEQGGSSGYADKPLGDGKEIPEESYSKPTGVHLIYHVSHELQADAENLINMDRTISTHL